MKFTALFSIAAALLAAVDAKTNYANVANTINKQSASISSGTYRFQNAKSGNGLHYVRSGQSIYAASGTGSWMSISTHQKHVVVSPQSSNKKCLSAAWSYSTGNDNTGALYACVVGSRSKRDEIVEEPFEDEVEFNVVDLDLDSQLFFSVEEARNASALDKRTTLRGAKQYFYVHPAEKVSHGYHIIAYDHLSDMATRVLGDGYQKVSWSKAKMANMVTLNQNDKSQVWYIYNKSGKRIS